MFRRLLFSFALVASASAQVNWNAPSSVASGSEYYVGATATGYTAPYVTIYKNNWYSVFSSNWYSAGAYTTDYGVQIVTYNAEVWDTQSNGTFSSTRNVTITANNPPSPTISVDGYSHGATITRPYGGSVTITVRYNATDPDGNLSGIRYNIWHQNSGYFNNGGGGFVSQSGSSGSVVQTVNLNANGSWYFWTDAQDSANAYASTGHWESGFRINVVEGPPPNTPPSPAISVDGYSYGATITRPYGGSVNITVRYTATDSNGNLSGIRYNIWNQSTGYFDNNNNNFASQSGSSGSVVKTVSLSSNGTWYFWTDAQDSAGAYASTGDWTNGFRINVNESSPPPPSGQVTGPSTGTVGINNAYSLSNLSNTSDWRWEVDLPGGGSYEWAGSYSTENPREWAFGSGPGTYRFRAHLRGPGGNAYTNEVVVTVSLNAPAATAATAISSSGFTANWNAVSGATNYRLDVSTNSGFGSYVHQNLNVGNATSYAVSGLSGNTTYYYRLRAENGSSTSGNSNTVSVTTNVGIPPAPSASSATSVASTSFTANWAASSGGTSYHLDVSTSSGFGSYVSGYQNRDVGNVTSFGVSGLAAGTTHYYRVRAVNGVGMSGNSNVITVNSPPLITAHPQNQTVTVGANASFSVSALADPAPTYQWQRQPAAGGGFSNLANGGSYSGVATTQLTVSGTTTGMSGDQFRCVATNSVGSATSNAATLTVNAAPPPPPPPPPPPIDLQIHRP